jgi:predicted esterase YcpF (UPF0227 family)
MNGRKDIKKLGGEMDKKQQILDKLNAMTYQQLDDLKEKKLLEYREICDKYFRTKDDIQDLKHKKRKELRKENSISMTENLLKEDDELYDLKKYQIELQRAKTILEIEKELINQKFWKARQ